MVRTAGRRGRRPLRKGCGAFITKTERYLVELQICYNPPPRFARHPPEKGGTSLVPPFRGLREAVGVVSILILYRWFPLSSRGAKRRGDLLRTGTDRHVAALLAMTPLTQVLHRTDPPIVGDGVVRRRIEIIFHRNIHLLFSLPSALFSKTFSLHSAPVLV